LEVFIGLLVLLLLTRALGEVAERLRQPASVGELLAGIVLAGIIGFYGRDVPYMVELARSDALEYVANAGIFFLVLSAGIEMEPREIARHSGASFAVAFGGLIVPMLAGIALAWLFLPDSELKSTQALLVGVALSITAIAATVKVFAEMGLLHTRVGETVISAAIFDDVLGLFLMALMTALVQADGVPSIAAFLILLVKVMMFFAITVALGAHVYPRVRRGLKAMQVAAVEFSALMAVALAYGLLAELLGMHWVLGAFTAGLYFERSRVGALAYNEMKLVVNAITSGFLGPLFFAHIGLAVDLGAITGVPLFLCLLVAVAFLGKLVGAGLPARWVGLERREALAVGVGMSSRGAVELIVLSVAQKAGLFAQGDQTQPIVEHLFSALVLTAVITTLVTPILLRRILPRNPP
jgi:Kef-type K+ transport system membrane component KefB